MAPRRRILVLTRHPPLPWEDGAGAYLFEVLQFLHARGFEIHVGWLAPHDHLRWQGVWRLPAAYATVVRLHTPGGWRLGRCQFYPDIYWLPFKARALHAAKRLLSRFGLHVRRHTPRPEPSAPPTGNLPATGWMAVPSAAEHAFASGLLARLRPATVIVNYAWLTPLFGDAPAGRSFHRVCLHPDIAWQRAAIQAALDHRAPEITPEREAALLQQASLIVSISETDAAEHRRLAPQATVLLAPKAVAAQPQPVPAIDSPRLLFVGSGNSFNAAGLAWFLAEVWPLIRASNTETTLDICGSVAAAVPARPAGVTFHGSVADLAPYYRSAALVIVPLLHATGLNIKLVDAAARGRAIVATSATLDGAPFLADAVRHADTPAAFAQAVLALLADAPGRAALGTRGLAAVARHLAPENCYAPLAAALA